MESKEIFINLIDELTGALDELGLYVIDTNLSMVGKDSYESYDHLRQEIINRKTIGYVDVDCFIGNQAWRVPEEPELFLDMSEIKVTDIAQYLQERMKEM
jgi:hypothetical protein